MVDMYYMIRRIRVAVNAKIKITCGKNAIHLNNTKTHKLFSRSCKFVIKTNSTRTAGAGAAAAVSAVVFVVASHQSRHSHLLLPIILYLCGSIIT